MITLQQKIGGKIFKEGQATKFPLPSHDNLNIIIVDERGFCGGDSLNRDQHHQINLCVQITKSWTQFTLLI